MAQCQYDILLLEATQHWKTAWRLVCGENPDSSKSYTANKQECKKKYTYTQALRSTHKNTVPYGLRWGRLQQETVAVSNSFSLKSVEPHSAASLSVVGWRWSGSGGGPYYIFITCTQAAVLDVTQINKTENDHVKILWDSLSTHSSGGQTSLRNAKD